MALVLKDRVMETTASTGTGTITLGGAVAGYQSFSVIGNANTTYYTISGGTEWEVGIGTYTSSGTTLSRDTVLESSNGGSLVNFSAGTKNVFVTYPAEKSVDSNGNQATGTWSISISGNAATVTNGVYTTGSYSNPSWITSLDYSKLTGTVPTWNQNTTGNAASADLAYEWKGSGSNSNWDQQFRDTLAASATQIDLNSGTNCPTGGGWWFAESFRHSNPSSYWGTQYAHGWEDRAYQRYVRNVSSDNFGTWRLDSGCRLWINFNNGSARGYGNVSSVSRTGTGTYNVNAAYDLGSANYSVVGTCGSSSSSSYECNINPASTSSVIYVNTHDYGNSYVDNSWVSIAVFTF